MRYTYDCEVSSHDWLVVFKAKQDGSYSVFHNDPEGVRGFLSEEDYYVGFNSKHYDQFIIKAICADFTPPEIKTLSEWLIAGGQGWAYPDLQDVKFWFNNIDIRDDMQAGLSLKAIEGHFGLSVQETTVDFNLDRPWTEQETEEMIHYCKHDVDTTERLTDARKEYLRTKMNVGAMAGIGPIKAMSMTNAKLTAAFLRARKPATPWTDERSYVFPANLLNQYIPEEVFDFFCRMHDPSVKPEDLWDSKLAIDVDECATTIAYGGIHGAVPCYQETETEKRVIRNYDVGSYYPHLMTINHYTSRNIPDPKIYEDMLEERMEAKKRGDKAKANALKLVANTTYGATLNQYNDLYDPLMARSVCVSGQLYLLELARHLCADCPTLKPVQFNTDGIMVSFDLSDEETVKGIVAEWQERTGFTLEEDQIHAIYQKDVNNYIEVPCGDLLDKDGKPRWKIKGGYLVRGPSTAGQWKVNNNACIVSTAIVDWFVKGIPPEETIAACQDISQFQMIAKAGAKYREAYWMVGEEKRPVQKVNRVYATADERYGKLYKVKTEDESTAKIEMLPEHCIIDNTALDDPAHTRIDQIDKSFYVALARKRINDFIGIAPEKKSRRRKADMPRTTAATKTEPAQEPAPIVEIQPLNIYQKLLKARMRFLQSNVDKSGKNNHLQFRYFELEDIVPVALPIFDELGLIPIVTFNSEYATMTIVNCDEPSEAISFLSPMKELSGNAAVNPLQALGAAQTYQRRYLYLAALDITEHDEVDGKLGAAPAAPKTEEPKRPATPETRAELKVQLTATSGNADELQLKGIIATAKKLREKRPDKEEWLAKVADTTKGFTEISRADCAKLMEKMNALIAEGEQK